MKIHRRGLLIGGSALTIGQALGVFGLRAAGTVTVAYAQASLADDWRAANQADMEKAVRDAGWSFTSVNANTDPAKQLSDVESLLSQQPTVLVLSPWEAAALTPAVDLCNDANVPLIVIDRKINAEPGKGMYKAEIVQSHFDSGVLLAQKTVELLTKKFGTPRGNVVRLMGVPGASTVIDPGNGWASVMKAYPDIKLVGIGNGQYNKDMAMKAMQDLLQRFPKGQIDVLWSDYSDMTMGAIEVIKNAGRDELLGWIVTEGGHRLTIEEVVKGEIARDTQTPPFFGAQVVDNVKKIIAGQPVEPHQLLKIKVFDADRPDEAKAYLAEMKAKGVNF